MSVMSLHINGKDRKVTCDEQTPLLWVLRDLLGLTGTKYGCGKGLCGACTVHMDGESVRSCSLPVGSVGKGKVTTIEGLAEDFPGHPLFASWKRLDVPQCGYCQPGQIMTAAALLNKNPDPDARAIREGMQGNICRCGTYLRLQQAVLSAGKDKV